MLFCLNIVKSMILIQKYYKKCVRIICKVTSCIYNIFTFFG